jgi:hypothetical protein
MYAGDRGRGDAPRFGDDTIVQLRAYSLAQRERDGAVAKGREY